MPFNSDDDFVFDDMFTRDPASDRRLDEIAGLSTPLRVARSRLHPRGGRRRGHVVRARTVRPLPPLTVCH